MHYENSPMKRPALVPLSNNNLPKPELFRFSALRVLQTYSINLISYNLIIIINYSLQHWLTKPMKKKVDHGSLIAPTADRKHIL